MQQAKIKCTSRSTKLKEKKKYSAVAPSDEVGPHGWVSKTTCMYSCTQPDEKSSLSA